MQRRKVWLLRRRTEWRTLVEVEEDGDAARRILKRGTSGGEEEEERRRVVWKKKKKVENGKGWRSEGPVRF